MPEEIKTFRGYSKTSMEEALKNAINQVPVSSNVDEFRLFPIIQMGKEIGGFLGRDDFFVVISVIQT